MNFHTSSGEDYYSEDRHENKKAQIGSILLAINSFDWRDKDIKDKATQEQLAARILSNIKGRR